MSEILTPRLSFVLIRRVTQTTNKMGIALPEKSEESRRYFVVASGPEVKDLKEGDEVIFASSKGDIAYWPLSNRENLILVRNDAIGLVITQIPEKDGNKHAETT